MSSTQDACRVSAANVQASIDRRRHFPGNVFTDGWSEFLFFDSDWMCERGFITVLQAVLKAERGECACVMNLDLPEDSTGGHVLSVKHDTDSAIYQRLLVGNPPAPGWLDYMARLGCASDIGAWCMYCEPRNDIAVVAFRSSLEAERYRTPLASFGAVRFEDAIGVPPQSWGFSTEALPVDWRRQFLREYATGKR